MSANPFNFNLITRPVDFIGRLDMIQEITNGLCDLNGNSYGIIGGRRFGKSSSLKMLYHELVRRLEHPDVTQLATLPIYVAFEAISQLSVPNDVLGYIAHRILQITAGNPLHRLRLDGKSLAIGLPDYYNVDFAPMSLDGLVETIYDVTSAANNVFSATRIALLIDEVEVTSQLDAVGILFGNLRSLVYSSAVQDSTRMVLAGSEFLFKAKQSGSPLLNMLKLCFLEAFHQTPIQELISRAEDIDPSIAREVVGLAGGHPFILQFLLHYLFEIGISSATSETVQAVKRQFIHDRITDLEGWWRSVGKSGRNVYFFLRQADDWKTHAEIIRVAQDETASDGLSALCFHGIVVHDKSHDRYRVDGSLFSEWVEERFQTGADAVELAAEQYKALMNALIKAFPEVDSLRRMVRFGLDQSLNVIAGGTTLADIVFDLIEWAESQGRTSELIVAARNENPTNNALRLFAEQLHLAPTSPTNDYFERTMLKSVPYSDPAIFRETMSLRELTVCRIEYPAEKGQGTGFLVGPDVVMTCYHVIRPLLADAELRKSAVLRFDYKIGGTDSQLLAGQIYSLAPNWLITSSLDTDLDYVLLQVDGTPGDDTVGGQTGAKQRGFLVPKVHVFEKDEPILILGHPYLDPKKDTTEPLKYTDGPLTALPDKANRITYKTNTEPGSSGSPCFNARWDLVALHSQAGNHGVSFSAIIDRLTQDGMLNRLGKSNSEAKSV